MEQSKINASFESKLKSVCNIACELGCESLIHYLINERIGLINPKSIDNKAFCDLNERIGKLIERFVQAVTDKKISTVVIFYIAIRSAIELSCELGADKYFEQCFEVEDELVELSIFLCDLNRRERAGEDVISQFPDHMRRYVTLSKKVSTDDLPNYLWNEMLKHTGYLDSLSGDPFDVMLDMNRVCNKLNRLITSFETCMSEDEKKLLAQRKAAVNGETTSLTDIKLIMD